MNVASPEWLLWMACTVALYWLVPKAHRDLVVIAVTFAYLLVHAPVSAAWFGFLAVTVFWFTRETEPSGRRTILLGAVVIGVIGTYKAIAGQMSFQTVEEAVIPLGLSYFCFRLLHYLIERYLGRLEPHGFREFASYLFFLPVVIAGPIHRFPSFLADRHALGWNAGDLSRGMERIVHGYAKIVILGNVFVSGVLARWIQGLPPENAILADYLNLVRAYLNLYFQFSGYSDVAIGFSLLLGYRIIENFRFPLLAPNITEFWRRWHISLTSWVREYVFSVTLALWRRPALSAVCAMIVIGLWHEASLRFIVWGLYHAAGILVCTWFQGYKRRLPRVTSRSLALCLRGLAVLATLQFVTLGYAITSQDSLAGTARVLGRILWGWWT
jgi:alginate O-acetyltransferase complex protein AlgI